MTDLSVHPLAQLLPMMDGDDYAMLLESMRRNGWENDDPAVLFDGAILDGRNRLRAAKELGLAPHVVDLTLQIADPVEFVARKNFWRRHLTQSQKAGVAARMLPALKEIGHARMVEAGGSGKSAKPSHSSRDRAAELLGVSPRLVASAADLPEEYNDRVVSGELTVGRARVEAGIGTGGGAAGTVSTLDRVLALVDGLDTFDVASIVTALRTRVGGKKGDTDSWCTPPEVRDPVFDFWPEGIDLDPMTNGHSVMNARLAWTIEDDCYKQDIGAALKGTTHRIWLNMIYSNPEPGMKMVADAVVEHGASALMLPKGDWSTQWWDRQVLKRAAAVCYWFDRVAFLYEGKKQTTATFPTALCYYGDDPASFCGHFSEYGDCRQIRAVSV